MMIVGTKGDTVIFVDLDDTLVDTFGLLITPLEHSAAENLCDTAAGRLRFEDVTATLLAVRKRCPAGLQTKLRELFPNEFNRMMVIRDKIFSNFSVTALTISDDVIEILSVLRKSHSLVLVTEGVRQIQQNKIRHLKIKRMFDYIVVVDQDSQLTKELVIAEHLRDRGIGTSNALIVGNRLDREIAAGWRLGIKTIWIRKGEGSEMVPEKGEEPSFTIGDFAELPAVLQAIPGFRGASRAM